MRSVSNGEACWFITHDTLGKELRSLARLFLKYEALDSLSNARQWRRWTRSRVQDEEKVENVGVHHEWRALTVVFY